MSDQPAEGVFWDDLNEDLKDEEFRVRFIEATEQIAEHDRIVNDFGILGTSLGHLGVGQPTLTRCTGPETCLVCRAITPPDEGQP